MQLTQAATASGPVYVGLNSFLPAGITASIFLQIMLVSTRFGLPLSWARDLGSLRGRRKIVRGVDPLDSAEGDGVSCIRQLIAQETTAMFKIGKEFHLLHVVRDLDETDEWYDRVFSVRRFVRNYMRSAMRKASLVLVGDFVMEPAQPVQQAGWEKSALGKFYSRFGQHFHSLAWYVDDLTETCRALQDQQIRLFDMVGKPVTDPGRGDAVWTHPQDTHAAFEFAVAPKYFIDPRLQPGWSMEFPRDQHPLGIERASHITMLFRDLADARRVYQEALGARLIHEYESAGLKRSAFYAVGEDTIIEAAQPLSTSTPEGRELGQTGEGIFAVTFRTKSLNRVAEHLRQNGVRFELNDSSLVIKREDAFGMVLGFTEQALPNDPRR